MKHYFNVVIKTHEIIIEAEILQMMKKYKLDNVSKSNDISNRILKLLINKLMSTLLSLFRVYATLSYNSRCFREAHIIALKKSNKSNYTNLKTYKFIILLNTLNKTFESIIVKRINNLTKTHKL
jgi:predicted cation transporter